MCQIFGYCGTGRLELRHMLKEFYSHSDRHPNGWGLAVLEGDRAKIEKETLEASKSPRLAKRLEESVTAPTVQAHIRYATIGHVELENCHPFTGKDADQRTWTLVHNGTIFDFSPTNKYFWEQKGETDSERILLYLLDLLGEAGRRKGSPLNDEERFAVLEDAIGRMAKGNKLNLLIYDGELLYVHTNFAGSLFSCRTPEGMIFSTEPLRGGDSKESEENHRNLPSAKEKPENPAAKEKPENLTSKENPANPAEAEKTSEEKNKEEWNAVPMMTLMAYKNGELVHTGKMHGNEYFEDEEALGQLYLAFAGL